MAAALATVLAAAIAAFAVLIGYWQTNQSKRLDARAAAYAQALEAIEAYKQLPYRIARRTESSPTVRADLGRQLSDIHQTIAFHRTWLMLDSVKVGVAYELLVDCVFRKGGVHRQHAWTADPISADIDMPQVSRYDWGDDKFRNACITAMRSQLRRRINPIR